MAALAFGVLASSPAVHAIEPRVCLAVGVSDGDTITARCGEPDAYEPVKVRIGAIDAPERRQPFGARAKEALSDLVLGKMAHLECNKADRYRRSVCSVWVVPASAPAGPKTLDVGRAMIMQGMAWWYRTYARERIAEQLGQYEYAELEALGRRMELRSDSAATPPWEHRAEARTATAASKRP